MVTILAKLSTSLKNVAMYKTYLYQVLPWWKAFIIDHYDETIAYYVADHRAGASKVMTVGEWLKHNSELKGATAHIIHRGCNATVYMKCIKHYGYLYECTMQVSHL